MIRDRRAVQRLADAAERSLPGILRRARPDIPFDKIAPAATRPSVERYGRELRGRLTRQNGAAVADGLLAGLLLRVYAVRTTVAALIGTALVAAGAALVAAVDVTTVASVEIIEVAFSGAVMLWILLCAAAAVTAVVVWHVYTARLPHPWKLRGTFWFSEAHVNRYRQRHLEDIPAPLATGPEITQMLARRNATPAVWETALVLAGDGYPGTLRDLVAASVELAR